MLPPALHQKYIGPNDITSDNGYQNQLEEAVSGVRDMMLSKSARRGEEIIPEMARDKKLRVGPKKTTKVAEIGSMADREMTAGDSKSSQTPRSQRSTSLCRSSIDSGNISKTPQLERQGQSVQARDTGVREQE
jgi:hypothetical protein